jgi:hypothetical protein
MNIDKLDGPAVSALSVVSACDRGSLATLVGHRMGDQKFTVSSFGRHVKPLVAAEFAVASTHQSALVRGELWPVLLMWNP